MTLILTESSLEPDFAESSSPEPEPDNEGPECVATSAAMSATSHDRMVEPP